VDAVYDLQRPCRSSYRSGRLSGKPGVLAILLALASAVGGLLIPIGADCCPSLFERHKWDDARNPLPYGRIAVACGELLTFPPFEDAASLENACQQLRAALDRATVEARSALGFSPMKFAAPRSDDHLQ